MTLLELPSELIAHIFTFLEDEDVFSARLSNRFLERSSFSYFTKHFFRKKGFMVTTRSLRALGHISEHEELSKSVQHLWFNPDMFTFVSEPPDRPAFQDCLEDHKSWLVEQSNPSKSRLSAILSLIFRNLPNLTTIGMRRSESHSAYDWSRLRNELGADPRVLGSSQDSRKRAPSRLSVVTQIFVALIVAVADSGVKLERLYTDAVEIDHIGDGDLHPAMIKAAFTPIKYIELNALRSWLNSVHWLYSLHNGDGEPGHNLVPVFQSMPNLKELGLQFLHSQTAMRRPYQLNQAYRYLAFERLVTSTTLPNLTRIKLENVSATSALLTSFLQPSARNLTSLKFRDIRLLPTDETDLRPWQTIFRFLASNGPQLGYILFYHLMHVNGGVSFVEELPVLDETQEYVVGQAVFQKYSHITLEVEGTEAVQSKLHEVAERHFHHPPLFSYAMDEDLWHTDTSDEEW